MVEPVVCPWAVFMSTCVSVLGLPLKPSSHAVQVRAWVKGDLPPPYPDRQAGGFLLQARWAGVYSLRAKITRAFQKRLEEKRSLSRSAGAQVLCFSESWGESRMDKIYLRMRSH